MFNRSGPRRTKYAPPKKKRIKKKIAPKAKAPIDIEIEDFINIPGIGEMSMPKRKPKTKVKPKPKAKAKAKTKPKPKADPQKELNRLSDYIKKAQKSQRRSSGARKKQWSKNILNAQNKLKGLRRTIQKDAGITVKNPGGTGPVYRDSKGKPKKAPRTLAEKKLPKPAPKPKRPGPRPGDDMVRISPIERATGRGFTDEDFARLQQPKLKPKPKPKPKAPAAPSFGSDYGASMPGPAPKPKPKPKPRPKPKPAPKPAPKPKAKVKAKPKPQPPSMPPIMGTGDYGSEFGPTGPINIPKTPPAPAPKPTPVPPPVEETTPGPADPPVFKFPKLSGDFSGEEGSGMVSSGTTVFDRYDPETDTYHGSIGGIAGNIPHSVKGSEVTEEFKKNWAIAQKGYKPVTELPPSAPPPFTPPPPIPGGGETKPPEQTNRLSKDHDFFSSPEYGSVGDFGTTDMYQASDGTVFGSSSTGKAYEDYLKRTQGGSSAPVEPPPGSGTTPPPSAPPAPPPLVKVDPFKGFSPSYRPENIVGQSFDPSVREDYEKQMQEARARMMQPGGNIAQNPTYQTPTMAVPQTQFGGYGQPMPIAPLLPYSGLAAPQPEKTNPYNSWLKEQENPPGDDV